MHKVERGLLSTSSTSRTSSLSGDSIANENYKQVCPFIDVWQLI